MIQRTLGEVDLSEFTADQAAVIREILLCSSGHPIPLATLCVRTHLKLREAKGIVEELRKAGVPVGARRGKPSGYYLCRTPKELEEAARPMVNQAKNMLVAAARMVPKALLLEMLGQSTISDLLEAK